MKRLPLLMEGAVARSLVPILAPAPAEVAAAEVAVPGTSPLLQSPTHPRTSASPVAAALVAE